MLVDNGSAVNILYWDTYKRMGLRKNNLSPMTSPLYKFTRNLVIPRCTIKLVVMMGEHPRTSTVVTEFLAVNCPSAFNEVIGRSLLKALSVVISIHCLIMKFLITIGAGQVQGRQFNLR